MTKQGEARERVLDLIERLGIGEAIPSERQLSVDLGFSRLTVRAALDDLVREGYLVRRRGAGTFVSEPKIAQELTMTSFTEDMRRRGMEPSSRTVDLEVVPAGARLAPRREGHRAAPQARRARRPLIAGSRSSVRGASFSPAGARLGRLLHVSPSEPIVVVTRLRYADRETMAMETLHVRESLVPGLTAADLEEHSFYELLEDRFGIVVVGGSQAIEPTVTNEDESSALGVPLHSPAFLFERTTRSDEREIVEYVRSIYRGDRYRLVSDLTRPQPGRQSSAGLAAAGS